MPAAECTGSPLQAGHSHLSLSYPSREEKQFGDAPYYYLSVSIVVESTTTDLLTFVFLDGHPFWHVTKPCFSGVLLAYEYLQASICMPWLAYFVMQVLP